MVLSDGVQGVSEVTADLIRATTGTSRTIPLLPPSEIAELPTTSSPIDVAAYPSQRVRTVTGTAAPALCLDWRLVDGEPSPTVYATEEVPMPPAAEAVEASPLAAAPEIVGIGSADSVYVPPGSGLVVAQTPTGEPESEANLTLITDLGVAYPVLSREALTALGLGGTISPVPPELVSLLPRGPTLDPEEARRYVTPVAPIEDE